MKWTEELEQAWAARRRPLYRSEWFWWFLIVGVPALITVAVVAIAIIFVALGYE